MAGVALLCAALPSFAADYEVGDGQPYATISSVPLESLGPGDRVLIHWRAAPYREKWVIAVHGTPAAPIVFRGIPGPGGELPIIDGANATTRLALNYWSEVRGIIKVGGASVPDSESASHIVIENLDVRGARNGVPFTDDSGGAAQYAANASAVFVELGHDITIRNCIAHDCGNGLFVASNDDNASQDIVIESCYIYGNGNAGSAYEHNTYTAAQRITYQYNRFGPLAEGAVGNALKDRSAGLVVRYNWIEGGNRQLDLVDGEDSGIIRADPAYRRTYVYGNVLIEPAGAGNRQICHYGGDSGDEASYRKGRLLFYHNTLVSWRTDRTTLFRLSSNDETCDAYDNIFFVSNPGNTLSCLDETGVLNLRRNWLKPGWVSTFGTLAGTINDDGSALVGAAPGFRDAAAGDFRLLPGSSCAAAASPLPGDTPPPPPVLREYVAHRQSVPREQPGAALAVGAFEALPPPCPGDVNCDAQVNFDDIDAFVAALTGEAAFRGLSPDCRYFNADLNGDDSVNFDDIDGFIARIVAGGCG